MLLKTPPEGLLGSKHTPLTVSSYSVSTLLLLLLGCRRGAGQALKAEATLPCTPPAVQEGLLWGLILASQVAHRYYPLLSLRTSPGAHRAVLRQKCSARSTQHPCFQTDWFQKSEGADAFGGYTSSSEIQKAADTFFSLPRHHGQLGDVLVSYSLLDDIPRDNHLFLV